MSKTIKLDGIVIHIEQDTDTESPREWDNLGTMVCFHSRYNLGDEQPKCSPEEFLEGLARDADPEIEEIEERVNRIDNHFYEAYDKPERLAVRIADAYLKRRIDKSLNDNYVMRKLFLYDHSGITMSTSSFSCPWDSGQVGWIYVSKDRVIKEYGTWDADTIGRVEGYLDGEVETYDQYLRGDVYGYSIEDADGDVIDSCWGFYGEDECEKAALEAARSYEPATEDRDTTNHAVWNQSLSKYELHTDSDCGVFN